MPNATPEPNRPSPNPAPGTTSGIGSPWAEKCLPEITKSAHRFGTPFVLDAPMQSGSVLVVKHYSSGASELPLYRSNPRRLEHFLLHQDAVYEFLRSTLLTYGRDGSIKFILHNFQQDGSTLSSAVQAIVSTAASVQRRRIQESSTGDSSQSVIREICTEVSEKGFRDFTPLRTLDASVRFMALAQAANLEDHVLAGQPEGFDPKGKFQIPRDDLAVMTADGAALSDSEIEFLIQKWADSARFHDLAHYRFISKRIESEGTPGGLTVVVMAGSSISTGAEDFSRSRTCIEESLAAWQRIVLEPARYPELLLERLPGVQVINFEAATVSWVREYIRGKRTPES